MDRAQINAEIAAARALGDAGNIVGALARLRNIGGEGFEDPRVLTYCAVYERALGQTKVAHKAALAALRVDPNYALAHRMLGIILSDLGSPNAAETSLREAIALQPDEPFHYPPLAMLLRGMDRWDEAEAMLRKAMSLAPDDPDCMASLAEFLSFRGRYDEAAPLIAKALEIAPDDPDILVMAGRVAIARNLDDDARDFAVAALQGNGSHAGALELLVQLKAKGNLVMSVWWRWNAWLSRMNGWTRGALVIGLLFGAQIFFRIARTVMPPPLLLGFLALWLGLMVLTWVGPYIYQRMLKREMAKVQLKPDF